MDKVVVSVGGRRSVTVAGTRSADAFSDNSNDEFLVAMKRVLRKSSGVSVGRGGGGAAPALTPRERRMRARTHNIVFGDDPSSNKSLELESGRISILASMVPDEIINKPSDCSVREYDAALMFVDVSGFTDLCETYTKAGRGAPSKITEVLNRYIGSMVQEILTHNGDVLKFSGDAFISMWKGSERATLQDVVHAAVDCGLLIQNNLGVQVTDVGLVLKVKAAIAAGRVYFSIIGDETAAHYVLVGQPVWDCKAAESLSLAGDLVMSPSAWAYVNEAEYWMTLLPDGLHKKVVGAGATWKRIEKLKLGILKPVKKKMDMSELRIDTEPSPFVSDEDMISSTSTCNPYREFALRPSVVSALHGAWWPALRRFMSTPVRRAVDNDEPMDCLTEVRRIVIVFLNVVNRRRTELDLIEVTDSAYKCVCSIVGEHSGLVNKVNLFDKDLMFLVAFGLRGSKHEAEAMRALQCAAALRERLARDGSFVSVSVGVTSGTAYCGVLGHTLRREYTVIGAHVNKAARLMTNYPNKVTCDKETFVHCKMDKKNFVSLPPKELKGIKNPGPIYEFVRLQVSQQDQENSVEYPLLGRAADLQLFHDTLDAALDKNDPRCAFVIIGPKMVGKTRLLQECMDACEEHFPVVKFSLHVQDKIPYRLIRMVFMQSLNDSDHTIFEDHIRTSVKMVSPLEVHAVNVIFNCRFPLPERFCHYGDLLSDPRVKALLRGMCTTFFPELCTIAVEEGHFIDDSSWQVMQVMLEAKAVFFLITISSEDKPTTVCKRVLGKPCVVKVQLGGVDRWYHAALACQMLGVRAIPADLEKVIQKSSGGMPGWIKNYVVSLLQSGWLQVVSVQREAALEAGAVLPSPLLLNCAEVATHTAAGSGWELFRTTYKESFSNLTWMNSSGTLGNIKMAVLTEGFNFEDMANDMSMDVIILKTYDSLTPFEKMLLKCGSVLGERFSRIMLHHLLQPKSNRKLALAVKKLFEAGVLACEGGDFTRDPSPVVVFPLRSPHDGGRPPYCACVGNTKHVGSRDLPHYAFCGYMKFKYTLFGTTMYDMLTEAQKIELHSRALMYLERYARRCVGCGTDCFVRLLGQRLNDGLTRSSALALKARRQIAELCEEVEVWRPSQSTLSLVSEDGDELIIQQPREMSTTINRDSQVSQSSLQPEKRGCCHFQRARSFSSFSMSTCECISILRAFYRQVIRHCHGAGELDKLMEGYLEYAALSVSRCNYSRALKLLVDAEKVVQSGDFGAHLHPWQRSLMLGRIESLRGACHLGLADHSEARVHLLQAMCLYGCPFPTSKRSLKVCSVTASLRQTLILNVMPSLLVGTHSGVVGDCFEEIANTLNHLHQLFWDCRNFREAELAAKWSLDMALRTDANFRLLCKSYANMINVARYKASYGKCSTLKRLALELCQRKRTRLDVTEVHAVAFLYSSIFRYYVTSGKLDAGVSLGLSARHLLTQVTEQGVRESLTLWLLMLLLMELRMADMVIIMRGLLPTSSPYYSHTCQTWYYYISLSIQLDTGYCVESYDACEQFFTQRGDGGVADHFSARPRPEWTFHVSMWLMCTRMGWWERRALWEGQVSRLMHHRFAGESVDMASLTILEGLLIELVNEVINRNKTAIFELEKHIKRLMNDIKRTSRHIVIYKPRYYFLKAYYAYIRDRKRQAFTLLEQSSKAAMKLGHKPILAWCGHTQRHWHGTLQPELEQYWMQHCQPGNLLDYRLFVPESPSNIVPYTLPLPRKN